MSKYFTAKELACQHCGKHGFDSTFLTALDNLREECGFPFVVTSAYRCPEHPIEAAKQRLGEHTTGKAVDIAVSNSKAYRVIEAAVKAGIPRIGVQQKGSSRFIHLGCNEDYPHPTVWSY